MRRRCSVDESRQLGEPCSTARIHPAEWQSHIAGSRDLAAHQNTDERQLGPCQDPQRFVLAGLDDLGTIIEFA